MTAATVSPRMPWPIKFGLLSLIWGSSFLLMMVGLRTFEPLQISTTRIIAGALVLLLLLVAAGGRLPRLPRTWAHLCVSSFFLLSLPFTLFALSETRISSALAGIGNATTPMSSVLFTALLLPAERVPARKVAAVLVGFLGVLVIMQPWHLEGRPDVLGFAMTVLAGSCYGIGWVYTRRFLGWEDPGGLSLPTAQLLVGAAEMILAITTWWLLNRDRVTAPWSLHPDPGGGPGWLPVVCVLTLGLLGTGLAQMMQFDVVRAAGPTVATTVTYLIPVVSVALGVLVLHERLGAFQLVGAAIVLCAAIVIGVPSRRRQMVAPVPESA